MVVSLAIFFPTTNNNEKYRNNNSEAEYIVSLNYCPENYYSFAMYEWRFHMMWHVFVFLCNMTFFVHSKLAIFCCEKIVWIVVLPLPKQVESHNVCGTKPSISSWQKAPQKPRTTLCKHKLSKFFLTEESLTHREKTTGKVVQTFYAKAQSDLKKQTFKTRLILCSPPECHLKWGHTFSLCKKFWIICQAGVWRRI